MTDIYTNKPAGTDPFNKADDEIRAIKTGFQERLNVDHVFDVAANKIADAPPVGNGGLHRQVTFGSALADLPSLGTGQAILFTKTVTVDATDYIELFYSPDGGTARQLTAGSLLNITKADLLPLLDADTLVFGADDAENAALRGKLYVPFSTDQFDRDGSGNIIAKTPATTGDATGAGIAMFSWGNYSGDGGNNRLIDTGVKIAYMTIKRTDGGTNPLVIQRQGASWVAYDMGTGSITVVVAVQADGHTIKVTNNAYCNTNAKPYVWFAIGERL